MTEIEEFIQQFPLAVQEILNKLRKFYITYSIAQTVPAQLKLSWSHYLVLMWVNDNNERNFYEIESLSNNWSLRELDRQINSSLYERISEFSYSNFSKID